MKMEQFLSGYRICRNCELSRSINRKNRAIFVIVVVIVVVIMVVIVVVIVAVKVG